MVFVAFRQDVLDDLHTHTCAFNGDQLVLKIGLDLGDPLKLVQGARDVLDATVAGHGHGKQRLFQKFGKKKRSVSNQPCGFPLSPLCT
jgi:hypothetical protein